jgi:hypothetical protein
VPPTPNPSPPRAPRAGGRGNRFSFSRCAFCCAPRFAQRTARKLCLQTKGRRSAERRVVSAAFAHKRSVACGARCGARPHRTRSPSGALPRLSPEALRASGSVRSRASWSRTTDPLPGQPAPGRPATWPAGRVSEPPADRLTRPIPGTAPAPSIGRHRLTSLGRARFAYVTYAGTIVKDRVTIDHQIRYND